MAVDVPKSVILQNAVFFIDTDKILPNPYQPRRDFDQASLLELADSIKQYGLLQPVTVSRKEEEKPDGGFVTMYELIAGERRLRAAKLAGLKQIPALIRVGDDNKTRLELAIIENLQREDLNPIDRAVAFDRLQKEFALKHEEIGKKMGKSRVYVTNTIRLLNLPKEAQQALSDGKISEGHTRPLLMLSDRPEEQMTLLREMLLRKMTVREAENLGRKVAQDKVRKQQYIKDPNILEIENSLGEKLGTRVHVEKRDVGGVIKIDFFSYDDLEMIAAQIQKANITETQRDKLSQKLKKAISSLTVSADKREITPVSESDIEKTNNSVAGIEVDNSVQATDENAKLVDDRGATEIKKDEATSDEDLYNIKNFTI
jgi:ParB family chromosome partitioning protein